MIVPERYGDRFIALTPLFNVGLRQTTYEHTLLTQLTCVQIAFIHRSQEKMPNGTRMVPR